MLLVWIKRCTASIVSEALKFWSWKYWAAGDISAYDFASRLKRRTRCNSKVALHSLPMLSNPPSALVFTIATCQKNVPTSTLKLSICSLTAKVFSTVQTSCGVLSSAQICTTKRCDSLRAGCHVHSKVISDATNSTPSAGDVKAGAFCVMGVGSDVIVGVMGTVEDDPAKYPASPVIPATTIKTMASFRFIWRLYPVFSSGL